MSKRNSSANMNLKDMEKLLKKLPSLINNNDDDYETPVKRPVGRPPKAPTQAASANKKAEEAMMEQLKALAQAQQRLSAKRAAENQGDNRKSKEAVLLDELPVNQGDVAVNQKSECFKCNTYNGRYVVIPCGHAPFCAQCLNKERNAVLGKRIAVRCPSCRKPVSEFSLFIDLNA